MSPDVEMDGYTAVPLFCNPLFKTTLILRPPFLSQNSMLCTIVALF